MSPSPRLLWCLAVWMGVALVASIATPWHWVWQLFGASLALVFTLDLVRSEFRPPLLVEREWVDGFPVGVESKITLRATNPTRAQHSFEVFDTVPESANFSGLPRALTMGPGQTLEFDYKVTFTERGAAEFGRVELRRSSPWGLWHRRQWSGDVGSTRVYPNFAPIVRYSLLSVENRAQMMGILRLNLRGGGTSFRQLREYRDGDRLSQIDWKATSRRQVLISREYEEERDQHVFFLLDSGTRMRALDGDLSQFDHALNAVLLLSFIALRQGDSVSLLSFGGSQRWLPAVKGAGGISKVLQHIYDLQPSLKVADFDEAGRRAMTLQRRRAMIVLLSNLRTEDLEELKPTIATLKRRHLVVVASLREQSVQQMADTPVTSAASAEHYGAAHNYLRERERSLDLLKNLGVFTVDCSAQELPTQLVKRYLEIKQLGAL